MAFFSKLKERLFKSSSKIDEGLEAITAEAAPEPPAEPPAPLAPSVTTPVPPTPAGAAVTLRAAAVEQFQIWGERAGVPVMTAPQGSDRASLAFDAVARAEADGADLLLIDTAERDQNRDDLMAELAKIVRVIRKRDAEAPHDTLLVLDATTGKTRSPRSRSSAGSPTCRASS